jgi:hypothetical protein
MANVIIKVPQIQVIETTDHKNNPVAYLEVLGQKILFARQGILNSLGADDWEEVFQAHLAGLLADLLLQRAGGALEGWTKTSPTGREV